MAGPAQRAGARRRCRVGGGWRGHREPESGAVGGARARPPPARRWRSALIDQGVAGPVEVLVERGGAGRVPGGS
ncbi:MAG: hypothetical protein WKG07_35760 [Hymenobacter sp.]